MIAGIGTGGWLALLLGRYRLNLSQAMAIYLELAPQITNKGRAFFGSKPYTLDQKRLVSKVDDILKNYGLKPFLLDDDIPDPAKGSKMRCKHAFAVGKVLEPRSDEPKYEIFRAYETRKTSGKYYHSGPNPRDLKVSAVCAATGATRYLLEPYSINNTTYSDDGFPNPHNITDLAMDEAYHIYGERPALSVIVNIGPGIPSDHDIEKLQFLSRQFSWPNWLPRHHRLPQSTSNSRKTSSERTGTTNTASTTYTAAPIYDSPPSSQQPLPDTDADPPSQKSNQPPTPPPERSSTQSSSSSATACETERLIERAIKDRLQADYPRSPTKIFTRLAPPGVREDLALNDVQVIGESSQEVARYLGLEETREKLREAARLYCVVGGEERS